MQSLGIDATDAHFANLTWNKVEILFNIRLTFLSQYLDNHNVNIYT